jgi:hypothetical protein
MKLIIFKNFSNITQINVHNYRLMSLYLDFFYEYILIFYFLLFFRGIYSNSCFCLFVALQMHVLATNYGVMFQTLTLLEVDAQKLTLLIPLSILCYGGTLEDYPQVASNNPCYAKEIFVARGQNSSNYHELEVQMFLSILSSSNPSPYAMTLFTSSPMPLSKQFTFLKL